jgi:hypothetical protein
MSHLKSIATSLFGTAILLTAVTGPVLAAPAQPTTPAKTAAPVAPVKSPQAQGVAITPKTISSKTAEYEATITIPVISGLKDKAYEAQLNAQLLKQAQDALKNTQTMSKEDAADAKKYGWDLRPHALDISYKAVSTGKLVSFSVQTYVYTGGAHGMTDVTYYTIANLDTAKNLQLSDLFQPGYDYRYVINHIIKQQIQADNTNLYDFESISDNQSFSFDKGNLVIHFGQYEIAAYAAGMPSFTIPARSFHNLLKPEIRALLQ